jgi:hypothetical protein
MTITYVGNGAWGTGQGAPLSQPQHDGNVFDHETRIAALEAIPAGVGVDDITSSGNVVTFHLSNATTIDIAFDLPVLNPRGEWQNNTAYSYPDVVTVSGLGLFIVLESHTSPASPEVFDPNAGDSDPYYQLLLALPELSVPPSVEVSGTTYTLQLDDAGAYLRCTNASGCEITFLTNVVTAFPVGTEIHFRQANTGAVSFAPAVGVTLNPQREGFGTETPWQGATVTAKKISSNVWDLIGPYVSEIGTGSA